MTVYDNEWFINRIKEIRPKDYSDYEFKEEYVNSTTYIKALHKPCGKLIDVLPNSFISRGSGCPDCSIKKRADDQRKPHDVFVNELPEGLNALEEYQGAFIPIKFHCTKCDETYKTKPHNLLNKRVRGCTRCNGLHRRTIEDVKKEISDMSNGEYKVLSEVYNNPHEPIKILHIGCGNRYMVSRANFRRGRRCPLCSSSKGEALVREILIEMGEKFYEQVKFEGLRYKEPLSYDFYLPDREILIEYQGVQHYRPVKHFGGEDAYKKQVEIDNLKRDNASKEDLWLVEIPYTLDNKEKIKNFLVEIL